MKPSASVSVETSYLAVESSIVSYLIEDDASLKLSSTTPPLFRHLSSGKNHGVSFGGSTALLDGGKPPSLSPRLNSTKRKVKQSIFLFMS
ncbi:hypothetical protein Bca52824_087885 [Brassica carinata]|uniref:Uncharacterized protein n=1 Tax=Brassica carinata TaxID=52824 RepID=A0A8X7PC82_BRACI|nr:hypothetical protein Bca52824_087885 [Brassica carinata]